LTIGAAVHAMQLGVSCTYLAFLFTENEARDSRSETEHGWCCVNPPILLLLYYYYYYYYYFDSGDVVMNMKTTHDTNSVFQRNFSHFQPNPKTVALLAIAVFCSIPIFSTVLTVVLRNGLISACNRSSSGSCAHTGC
jgi:hypothetical protein